MERFALRQARFDEVRRLVRAVVLKHPLILGTALEKIQDRLSDLMKVNADWSDFVTILRRSEEKHQCWVLKESTRSLELKHHQRTEDS